MIDQNIKPTCDQLHGLMTPTTLTAGSASQFTLSLQGFRCEFCQRIYTLAGGYRTHGTPGPPDPGQPRCKEHRCAMFVSERLPNFLRRYSCPVDGCAESATVEVELDEADGFWKPKQLTER